MSVEVESFLDETPGETRGIVARDGRYHHLIIQRPEDPPACRLGARSNGRIVRLEPGLRGAFVDLGGAGPAGFLRTARDHDLSKGAFIEVVTTAEPRAGKGPALRLLGQGTGRPGLVEPGPDVRTILAELAPEATPITDAAAIRASLEAEEEALAATARNSAVGMDVVVQRTRALLAIDIDHAPAPRRDARKGRAAANREGLFESARLIRLRGEGGLVVVDLVGGAQDEETIRRLAREAFGAEAVVGPVSRFGLLQLTLPWKRTPLLDRLSAEPARARAVAAVRALRAKLLEDRSAPRYRLRLEPEAGAIASVLAAQMGPRALVSMDSALGVHDILIEEV